MTGGVFEDGPKRQLEAWPNEVLFKPIPSRNLLKLAGNVQATD
jgi:hypothetical protein